MSSNQGRYSRHLCAAALTISSAGFVQCVVAIEKPGPNIQPSIETTKTTMASPTMNKIIANGEVNLGIREDSPPFASMKDGMAKGYSVDICNKIAKGLETAVGRPLRINYVPVNAKSRIPFILEGKIDIECGSTTHTEERAKSVAFTLPVFVTGVRMAIRSGETQTDLRNLTGKTVAVVAKSTAVLLVEKSLNHAAGNGKAFTIISVPDNDAGVQAVAKGHAYAFVTDDILLAGAIQHNALGSKVKRDGPLLSVEPYALIVRKDDPKFVRMVDRQISEIFHTGDGVKLAEKWTNTPELRYTLNTLTLENFRFPTKFAAPTM